MLKVYLAGAIRDDHSEDWSWREYMIDRFTDAEVATILNPMGGKTYQPVTHEWRLHDELATTDVILPHDFYMVDHCDILVANLQPLAEGYPSVGTLVEWGRATGRPVLRYAIVKPGWSGHANSMFHETHPFIAKAAAKIFYGVVECADFLVRHLPVIDGSRPRFGGQVWSA